MAVYFLFGKMLSLLCQIWYILGLCFVAANERILKNILTIWSHCFWVTPLYIKQQVVSTSSPSSANVTNLRAVKLLYRIKHKDWMLQVLLLDLTNQSALFFNSKEVTCSKISSRDQFLVVSSESFKCQMSLHLKMMSKWKLLIGEFVASMAGH